MINEIKGAVFDMDGTLVDSLMIWDVLWEELGKRFMGKNGFRPLKEDDKAVRTMLLSAAMEHIHEKYNMAENGEKLLECANEISRDFYENKVELKPGVAEFLECCQEKGIKMCIASATDINMIKIAMEHCGIGKYFSEIFSCAVIGKGKDEPDIYLHAMEYLGTTREETCVFEDSAVAIETAVKIGMKTVAIYDKFNYGQDLMKKIANEYIADGETLMKLV